MKVNQIIVLISRLNPIKINQISDGDLIRKINSNQLKPTGGKNFEKIILDGFRAVAMASEQLRMEQEYEKDFSRHTIPHKLSRQPEPVVQIMQNTTALGRRALKIKKKIIA